MQRIVQKSIKMILSLYSKSLVIAFIAVCSGAVTGFAQPEAAPDEENCLICHRYPNLGRYDEDGTRRIYYINGVLFGNSVHGKVRCKGCHTDLDKIPHDEVKVVDCATQCHIKEPSSNLDFSHKNMVKKYENSVHGQAADEKKKFPEDLPTCTYCHENRSYNPYEGIWGKSAALALETLARCQACHTEKDWTEEIYAHFTHRMRRQREQDEIVRLCTSCHENEQKMMRHGLEVVSTFKDTFHWTMVKYGVKNAPDCISCHVPVGYTTHEIQHRTDPVSPINTRNRVKTCSNQGGVQECHPRATADFAEGRVHAYGSKVQLLTAREAVIAEAEAEAEDSVMLVRARKEVTDEEIFYYKVLSLIRLAYQVLIGSVIGFMVVHQLLDFRRTRKKMKTEGIHH